MPLAGDMVSSAPPMEVASGELVPTSGVLWIKPNGGGVLVQPSNNYVPQAGDALVPRSLTERLHLQAGLMLAGSARRAGNNLEFIGLEQDILGVGLLAPVRRNAPHRPQEVPHEVDGRLVPIPISRER